MDNRMPISQTLKTYIFDIIYKLPASIQVFDIIKDEFGEIMESLNLRRGIGQ